MSNSEMGILYLVATPIGNLEDMTFRAVRTLQEVDIIGAEDTRNTRKLLSHFDIHTDMVSYHEHNKLSKGPELIKDLLAGKSVAIVSDAGLPGISDPGTHIAQLAIEEGIRVTPVPGANAGLSALICSGMDTVRFTFIGFLPKTTKKRIEELEALKGRRETLIFYESPHRIKDVLKEMGKVLGLERKITLGRELTKKFEEFMRGNIGDMINYFQENDPRGEFVIILAGADEETVAALECQEAENAELVGLSIVEMVNRKIAEGMDKKAAMKEVAKLLNISKREVYQNMVNNIE